MALSASRTRHAVPSLQRVASNTIPSGTKVGGNHPSGTLVAREARRLGFGEGIAMASTGPPSEGAGENLFLVFDSAQARMPVGATLLNGITRNSIIALAHDDALAVIEFDLPRVLVRRPVPVRHGRGDHVDPLHRRAPAGADRADAVRRRIQRLFFGLFDGRTPDKHGWSEPA